MTKRSVSLAIRDPQRPGSVLLVQRPDDDEDLPGAWGLPAASLLDGESWSDAALRAGRDKLGVELELDGLLNQGTLQRSSYELEMQLLGARVKMGTPHVPQPFDAVTQYQAWCWGEAAALQPAADRGSLCSRLYLESRDT